MGSRPLYESERDRERELSVMQAALAGRDVSAVKLPAAYEVDFGLMREGKLIGVAEVKVRSKAFDTLMLSLHKARALRAFAEDGLEAWVVACVPEGIYALAVKADELFDLRLGGRSDRGDWQDIEPVVHFPMPPLRVADAPESVC